MRVSVIHYFRRLSTQGKSVINVRSQTQSASSQTPPGKSEVFTYCSAGEGGESRHEKALVPPDPRDAPLTN